METEVARIRLVVGLGNPGREYDGTRHNVGFAVVDSLVTEAGLKWEQSSKWRAAFAKGTGALFVKPTTYMNRSGEPVSVIADFYKIPAGEILIVLDDLALDLGRLRVRLEGSSGGHNGLESVIMHLATESIPRLRVGIGSAPREGAVDYVLGRFFEEEKPLAQQAVARAADAVKVAIDKGVLSAMNTFNKIPES